MFICGWPLRWFPSRNNVWSNFFLQTNWCWCFVGNKIKSRFNGGQFCSVYRCLFFMWFFFDESQPHFLVPWLNVTITLFLKVSTPLCPVICGYWCGSFYYEITEKNTNWMAVKAFCNVIKCVHLTVSRTMWTNEMNANCIRLKCHTTSFSVFRRCLLFSFDKHCPVG